MILTKKDFSLYIEDEFAKNDMNMVETVLQACEDYNVDPEMVEPLINRSVKEKMYNNFVDLNFIKRESKVII